MLASSLPADRTPSRRAPLSASHVGGPRQSRGLPEQQRRGEDVDVPRILVVDDEPLICWSLEVALTKVGCCVIAVRSGEEAIMELAAHPYDLLITDMRLPHTDGFEVARAAKQRSPALPVIMITAYGNSRSEAKASSISIDSFISKPFDIAALADLALMMLSKRKRSLE